MYTTIKLIHMITVFLSFIGFFTRGILLLKDSTLMKSRFVKVSPHLIDTVLLISAISLAVLSSQSPFSFNWLSAKIIGLVIYIGLGLYAFRFANTKGQIFIAWCAALLVYLTIVLTAVYKPF